MTCNYYESTNFENLLSNTNSTYSYCSNCNSGFDLAYKNMAIDAVLKQLLNVLTTSNEGYLILEVKVENDFIFLIINNVRIISVDFKYDFLNKDVYYLENIISELVEDSCNFNLSNVDIIVCE